MNPENSLCHACSLPIRQPAKGRKAKYCGDACKQAAYRLRQSGFERQRCSSRTQAGFVPAPPQSGVFRLLTLRNETANSNGYKQTHIVDLVGLV